MIGNHFADRLRYVAVCILAVAYGVIHFFFECGLMMPPVSKYRKCNRVRSTNLSVCVGGCSVWNIRSAFYARNAGV
jgi:hypothetical protein